MVKQYETTFIINVHLQSEQIDATIEKFKKFIENNGGKVKFIDRWGKHRLAYEIAKNQYGYYVYIRFEGEGSWVNDLEREFKLDDSIIRYLTVLVPKVVLREEIESKTKTPETKSKETPKIDETLDKPSAIKDTPSLDKDKQEIKEGMLEDF
jgi:small subunit ribosomal protein S6